MVERSEVQPDDPKQGQMDTPELDQTMDKFQNDYDKLDKSYKALQAEFTRKSQELADMKKAAGYKPDAESEWKTEGNTEEAKPDGEANSEESKETSETEEGQTTILPGFTNEEAEEISQYAWDNRELTDDHYAKLAEKGYSKEIVDEFMAGQFARAEGAQAAVYEAGGGEENVQRMFAWARDNLSEAVIEAYDTKFDAGGADAIMAMENLKARYDASGQAAGGKTVTGANAPKGETSKFTSTTQVTEAMSDPRYESDPAYRKSVQEKLARSKVL